MQHFKAVTFRVSQFDLHMNAASLRRLYFVTVFHKTDVEKAGVIINRRVKAKCAARLIYVEIILCVVVESILVKGDLIHFKFSSGRNARIASVFYSDPVISAVAGKNCLLDRRTHNAIDGKALGRKFDLVYFDRLGYRLRGLFAGSGPDTPAVLRLELRFDELRLLLFFYIKMDGVDARIRGNLHRFLILNPYADIAGRFNLLPLIEEADVIELREGYARVPVVFPSEFFLRPVNIELIFLFILFFRDFADLKSCSFVQSALRGDCCVDVVIPALCVQDSPLRKQLFLRIRGNFSPGLVSYPRTGVLRIRFRCLCPCRLSVLRIRFRCLCPDRLSVLRVFSFLRSRCVFFDTYFHRCLRIVLSVVYFVVTLFATALFGFSAFISLVSIRIYLFTCRLHFYPGLLFRSFPVQSDRGKDHRISSYEHDNTR